MTMHNVQKNGFAALTSVLMIAAISVVMIGGFTFVALREARILRAFSASEKSYRTAEAGIEDAVYRFISGKEITSGETLSTAEATTTVSITTLGSRKTIISTAYAKDLYHRSIRAELTTDASEVGFGYGVQVGAGGLTIGDNSRIVGDVFSNGNIIGSGPTKSTVTGVAKSAGNNLIKDVRVNKAAYGGRLEDCTVDSVAYYVTLIDDCTASSTSVLSSPLSSQAFPISQSQIDAWKAEATAGGNQGGLAIGNNESVTLGPKKINGSMSVGNGSTVTLSGVVWVTGALSFGNNVVIQLSPSYASRSGMLIVDGPVSTGNTATLKGSGQSGSYLMIFSNYGPGVAINIGNNATSSIFYAPNGIINIGNGLSLKEATAYGVTVGNNASVTYEQGLLNVSFISTPLVNWIIRGWEEIE